MTHPYAVYANGVLAVRRKTLHFAIKEAMRFFPSYIVDTRSNVVVWTGAN